MCFSAPFEFLFFNYILRRSLSPLLSSLRRKRNYSLRFVRINIKTDSFPQDVVDDDDRKTKKIMNRCSLAADERFFLEEAFCVSALRSEHVSFVKKETMRWLKGDRSHSHSDVEFLQLILIVKINVKHMLAYSSSSSSPYTCFHNQPCLMSSSTRHILRRSLFRIQLYFRSSSTIPIDLILYNSVSGRITRSCRMLQLLTTRVFALGSRKGSGNDVELGAVIT